MRRHVVAELSHMWKHECDTESHTNVYANESVILLGSSVKNLFLSHGRKKNNYDT